jgi:hypothetical protein
MVQAAYRSGCEQFACVPRWDRVPAIDLSLFEHRTYRFVNLATFTFGIALAMMFFSIFRFLTGVWGDHDRSGAGMSRFRAAAPTRGTYVPVVTPLTAAPSLLNSRA